MVRKKDVKKKDDKRLLKNKKVKRPTKNKVNTKAKSIMLKSSTDREILLIHGYTGSPTDFNKLPEYLHKRFNATVKVPRLLGHGEVISALDKVKYKDFLEQVERLIEKELKEGKKIVVGGISFGALLAFELASKYPKIKGILAFSVPYKCRFLPGLISFWEPIIVKKKWKKPIPEFEKPLRDKAFYYDIHLKGFRVIKRAKRSLKDKWKDIHQPCFIMHVKNDKVFDVKTLEILLKKLDTRVQTYVFEGNGKAGHNPFYSPYHEQLYERIGDFFDNNKMFK